MSSQLIEAFAYASARVLKNWTALTFAVEHGTAGNPRETAERQEALLDVIIDFCCARPGDSAQLANILFNSMEEDFNVSLEDGSENDVAKVLCELYRRIVLTGDISAAQAIPDARPGNLFQFPDGAEESTSDEEVEEDIKGGGLGERR